MQSNCWNDQGVELQTMEGATLRVSGHHAMYTFWLRCNDAFTDLLDWFAWSSPVRQNTLSQWLCRSMMDQWQRGFSAREEQMLGWKKGSGWRKVWRRARLIMSMWKPLLFFCSPPWCPSNFNTLHCLVDGLQQSSVLRVLVAVFVSKHAGESIYVAVEVLLRQRLLLHTQVHTILDFSFKRLGSIWIIDLLNLND